MNGYTATIKVLFRADSEGEAADYLSETLRNLEPSGMVDWGYVVPLAPADIGPDYQEGDMFAVEAPEGTLGTLQQAATDVAYTRDWLEAWDITRQDAAADLDRIHKVLCGLIAKAQR